MTEYTLSDTHFGHEKMVGESGFVTTRQHFSSVEDMGKQMIDAWNSTVQKDTDTVYFVGDFAMNLKSRDAVNILKQLRGNIVFIKGNHDSEDLRKHIAKDKELNKRVEWCEVGKRIKRFKHIVYFTHYPMVLGNRPQLINIHGHIHEEVRKEPNLLNVGVDSPERPILPFGTPLPLDACIDAIVLKIALFEASSATYTKSGEFFEAEL